MSVECRCKLDEELVFRSIGDEEDDGAVTDPDEAGKNLICIMLYHMM